MLPLPVETPLGGNVMLANVNPTKPRMRLPTQGVRRHAILKD